MFDQNKSIIASAQKEFTQHYPQSGWVEHDPEDIWISVLETCKAVLKKAKVKAADVVALGITNQRETTLIWDRATGTPIYNAIVWQDRRTVEICTKLREDDYEKTFRRKTGLLLDPYFSGTKAAWILDNVSGARKRAENGELAFGTVDTFLLWRLTGGKSHATDATNACRTLMFDIHRGEWSKKLCKILNVPRELLPDVKDCAAEFGACLPEFFGSAIPVRGMAGDQHAAMVGQACFKPGMMKSTYGTGCFALLNTGEDAVDSKNRLLTTIAYQLNGERTYALEGSIFIAGAAVQWLRDGLKIIGKAGDSGALAEQADPGQNVILVPAFVGLGAPYWDAECRGALFGLTRGTTNREIAKAALEAVCFQTRDLLEAMKRDWDGNSKTVLRVDGGMSASDWTMQALSDILGVAVDRPTVLESTALGAAYLAGYQSGLYEKPEKFAKEWSLERRFTPMMGDHERKNKYAAWKEAVFRTLGQI